MDTRKYLLSAEDIEKLTPKQLTHFLNPKGIRLNKSLGDAVGMKNMGVHMIYVEPNHDSTEFHKHLYEEECIYVISGTGLLTIETDEYQISAGDFVGLPANEVAHQLSNNGTETLVCLVMGQRLTHDVADYPNKAKRIYRHNGHSEVVEHKDLTYPNLSKNRAKK